MPAGRDAEMLGNRLADIGIGGARTDRAAAETRPWLFYYPGILILLLVLAVNLIGEGIRNAFDPRHNRVRD